MIIKKKTWPDYFQKILTGEKRFDARIADFKVQPGDTLLLEEYDPETKSYTGRTLEKKITFVAKTKDWVFFDPKDVLEKGYIIMSLD